jgi:8-oxo-dGTP pyrophosphatase MutT (NUDIX family)
MRNGTVVPLDCLELRFARRGWRFAEERRCEIDRHFATIRASKPQIWNGRVLVLETFEITNAVLRGTYIETDFASLLAWRDWGFPDGAVRNCFAMGALRGSDGAFVLGVMGSHTANAGKIYFFGGTPDPDDVVGDAVDLHGSIERELTEETGILPSEVEPAPGWYAIFDGGRIAMIKVLRAPLPAARLGADIRDFLAREPQPELADVRLVRGRDDFDPMMPPFVVAFFEHVWRPR